MDIVKLLRNRPLYESYGERSSLPDDAADEIERLREALQQVADFELHGDYSNAYRMPTIARAALKELRT